MDLSLKSMLRMENVDKFMNHYDNRREIYKPGSNTMPIFTLNYFDE